MATKRTYQPRSVGACVCTVFASACPLPMAALFLKRRRLKGRLRLTVRSNNHVKHVRW